MELETKQTKIKSRVDRVIRLQYDVGSDALTVFFNVSTKIGEEEFSEFFDSGAPINVPIAEVKKELDFIFEKAMKLRSEQIDGKTTLKIAPDYKTFFNELLALPIFRLAQKQNREDLILNAAYTDFSIILSNAIAGAENIPALQASFNAVLAGLVLGNEEEEEYLAPLRDAIARCNIPLSIKENT